MDKKVRIEMLSPKSFGLDRLYDIMIHAYAVTEVDIWGENYVRMPRTEFDALVKSGNIFGLYVDSAPVGSIQLSQLRSDTFVFGLLSVDFDFKGMNLGRMLINAVEEEARLHGGKYMELEILRLKKGDVAYKERLKEWYVRQGYEHIETIDFAVRKPTKAWIVEKFKQPSVFDCYRKVL